MLTPSSSSSWWSWSSSKSFISTTHDERATQHHSGPHIEWMKRQWCRRVKWKNKKKKPEENGLRLRPRSMRLCSCEKVSNSGNGMQSSNILRLIRPSYVYSVCCTYISSLERLLSLRANQHKATHKHSIVRRFNAAANPVKWDSGIWIEQENGNVARRLQRTNVRRCTRTANSTYTVITTTSCTVTSTNGVEDGNGVEDEEWHFLVFHFVGVVMLYFGVWTLWTVWSSIPIFLPKKIIFFPE